MFLYINVGLGQGPQTFWVKILEEMPAYAISSPIYEPSAQVS